MEKIKNVFLKLNSILAVALAQTEAPPVTPPGGYSTVGDIHRLLMNIVKWFVAFLVLGSVIYIVLAGWRYVTSGGDEEKISTAKTWLTYGIIGIIIAGLAYVIPKIIFNFLGGQAGY